MTADESKDYMAKTEVHQLFEGMLTGLLYHKPEDHLAFLENCLSLAKSEKDIRWNSFLDLSKKPLPPIPKADGPIKSESGDEIRTFTTEAEMKQKSPLPPISRPSIDDDDKELTERNILTDSEEEVEVEFSGQRIVYVLGGPGSGKGTQCTRIVEEFGYIHLSAGDLLRQEVAKGNEIGQNIEEIMKEGKLVPQEITIGLLRDAMRHHKDCPGFLIDGFPREIAQGLQFEKEVVESDFLLFFDCSEEIMEERLLKRSQHSERPDDNIETIKKRFATFTEKTLPVVDHYEKDNKVKKIDANRTVDEVFAEVRALFGALPPKEVQKIKRKKKKAVADEQEEYEFVEFSGQRIVFVLGGPGCGKGTQCARIVERFGYCHLSTGDLLRAEVESGSERGQKIAQIMQHGDLVPQLVLELLKDAMLRYPDSPGFLLDGFPREMSQAEKFEEEVVESHFVLYFECSTEVMEERLIKRGETSGRADDNAETIKKRVQTYVDKTMPVLESYGEKNKLKKVDATRPADEIFTDVCTIFGDLPKLEKKRRKKGKKAESGEDSEYDELAEGVDDLTRIAEGKPIKLRRRKKKKKDEDEEPRTPIYEPQIISEEFVPLMDDSIAKTDGKGLLNVRVIFVIGGPGCGKGTQCARIVETFGYTHLSTGDLLREEVQSESPRSKQLVQIMEKGELIPTRIILELLRVAMVAIPNTKGFIVDGFPREMEQGKEFENEIASCEFVLYFECSPDSMKRRLVARGETSGRVDDNEETIVKRLEMFENETKPVIEYYESQNKVKKILAEGSPDEVFAQVSNIFENLPNRKSTSLHDYDVTFITGPPGTGKTDLGRTLAEATGRTHLSVGQILREEAKQETEEAQAINQAITTGVLVAADLVLTLLTRMLEKEEKNLNGYCIDGYPRTEEQLDQFKQKVSDYNRIIVIESNEEEMDRVVKERAETSEREDDTEEISRTKLEVYNENTRPMVDSLGDSNKTVKVSAALPKEEVVEDIRLKLMAVTELSS
ncbi:hypothetical protein OS493_005792 [Desmophyllum pertusum]|uniref:UMP-CMP kinase n=1 Tax=Desmophyllum pertusum TaxID=174260 RepID=A0A9X0CFT6_9CNID|nr:hypothetical protein OS493_005792 [Desmophyllum pertusum]